MCWALKSWFFLHAGRELRIDGSETFGRKKTTSRVINPNFIPRAFLLAQPLLTSTKVRLPLSRVNGRKSPDAPRHKEIIVNRDASDSPDIRQGDMMSLCQDGKNNPDALWKQRGYKSFLLSRSVCWHVTAILHAVNAGELRLVRWICGHDCESAR